MRSWIIFGVSFLRIASGELQFSEVEYEEYTVRYSYSWKRRQTVVTITELNITVMVKAAMNILHTLSIVTLKSLKVTGNLKY